jgi:sugar phosphate isomerase/epimerase
LRGHSPTNENALIGEGTVAWDEVFAACEGVGGTEWYIVEQEVGLYSPLECAERCLKSLREMGK